MKYIKRLWEFFSGIRISAVFMMVISLISVYSCVSAFAVMNDDLVDYRIIKNNKLRNAYMYCFAVTPGAAMSGSASLESIFSENVETIKRNTLVEKVYTVQVANYVGYKDDYCSILIYEPGFAESFPELVRFGLDFSSNPEGCILSSDYFNDIETGDYFEVTFMNRLERTSGKLLCSGHMTYPYKHFEFGGSGTYLTAAHLISDGPVLIMQASDKTMGLLEEQTHIAFMPDILFVIKDDAPEKDVEEFIQELKNTGFTDSLESIVTRTRDDLYNHIRGTLIRPLIFMFATIAAHLSIVVLMVYKKRREMAVCFLCGATKKELMSIMFGTCFSISLIPTIFNIVYILIAPQLIWSNSIEAHGKLLTADLIWFVVIYFVITVIVAAAAVLLSMGRKSPLENLRGLE